jgi:hypothetical protein
MYHNLGHLAAFVCELAIVAVRGVEGIGLLAITALLSSAYGVSVWLVRDWSASTDPYAPWAAQSQIESAARNGQDSSTTE